MRHLGHEGGSVALEFALILPLLAAVLTATIDYGRWFAIRIAVIHAATEGARASVAGLDEAERRALAEAQVRRVAAAYGPLLGDDSALTIAAATAAPGTFRIAVSYAMGGAIGLVPLPGGPIGHVALVSYGGY